MAFLSNIILNLPAHPHPHPHPPPARSRSPSRSNRSTAPRPTSRKTWSSAFAAPAPRLANWHCSTTRRGPRALPRCQPRSCGSSGVKRAIFFNKKSRTDFSRFFNIFQSFVFIVFIFVQWPFIFFQCFESTFVHVHCHHDVFCECFIAAAAFSSLIILSFRFSMMSLLVSNIIISHIQSLETAACTFVARSRTSRPRNWKSTSPFYPRCPSSVR